MHDGEALPEDAHRSPPGEGTGSPRRALKGALLRAVGLDVAHRSQPTRRAADRGRRRTGTASGATAAVLLGLVAFPGIAGAAVQARATGTPAVGAGTWGATASVPSMTFNSNTFQTSTVTNIGTIALSAQSYSITISRPTGRPPTFTVFQCAVPWVFTRCSGGPGTPVGGRLSANSTTVVTSTTTMAPGASVYLQVEPSGVRRTTTVTISPQVTAPSQLRFPVHSNQ